MDIDIIKQFFRGYSNVMVLFYCDQKLKQTFLDLWNAALEKKEAREEEEAEKVQKVGEKKSKEEVANAG